VAFVPFWESLILKAFSFHQARFWHSDTERFGGAVTPKFVSPIIVTVRRIGNCKRTKSRSAEHRAEPRLASHRDDGVGGMFPLALGSGSQHLDIEVIGGITIAWRCR
jgi:hypothetical protein